MTAIFARLKRITFRWRLAICLLLFLLVTVAVVYTAFGGGEPAIEDVVQCLPDGNVPARVLIWLDDHKAESGYDAFSVDGIVYLAVRRGEKPTGGYTVALGDVKMGSGEVKITVATQNPKPWDIVTMAFTYPYSVIAYNPDSESPQSALFVSPQGSVLARVVIKQFDQEQIEHDPD